MPHFTPDKDVFDPERTVFLKEYGRILLRPIRPSDEKRMIHFHKNLSEESIYLRYFEHISLDTRTLHERLAKVCTNSEDSFAIVAERHHTSHHPAEILAVGRLTTSEKPGFASFALLMEDEAAKTQLPKYLLTRLIDLARVQGFQFIDGELLAGDHDMLTLCREMNFTTRSIPEDGIVRVNLVI